MIGYILEGLVNSLEEFAQAIIIGLFVLFVVLPVLFTGFFTSAVYAVQAVSYYFMIKNETYLRRGWSFTRADIIEEEGVIAKICWFTDQRSYTHSFHGFSYDDTLPILYKIKKPKRFIRCDEKYWRSRIRTRCIVAALFGVTFLLVLFCILL